MASLNISNKQLDFFFVFRSNGSKRKQEIVESTNDSMEYEIIVLEKKNMSSQRNKLHFITCLCILVRRTCTKMPY